MQQTEFLKKVQEYGDLTSSDEALQATEAFLSTLGEWLYRTEARKLMAQLPNEFQDFIFKVQKPETMRGDTIDAPIEEFYNRMKARVEVRFDRGVVLAQAVGQTLRETISAGEMDAVLQELPDDFNQLFVA
jgi:uncharacterized protein (DUF2267 family)